MNFFKYKYISLFFMVLFLVAGGAYLLNISDVEQKPLNYNSNKNYYIIQDEAGNTLMATGIKIYVDDEFIDENNNHYIVTAVKNNVATASIKDNTPDDNTPITTASLFVPAQALQSKLSNKRVGIYLTHNDESYKLTSGKTAKPGDGDIMQVGKALKNCLEKSSVKVDLSLNDHGPHDINAYHRSRKTAIDLIKKSPDLIIDLHRDSAPFDAYYASINGVEVSKVMIVIGRTNPNMQTNLEFAKGVKSISDELYPGLMRGIFMGKGDYNQDLYPTALLFEVGTDENSLSMAKKGVHCLGDVLIYLMQKS